ncbi:MAG: hypothetical protein RJA98_3084, partial [Pseudomonadota bacterium]
MQGPVRRALCHIRFAPCPPPACGRLPLDLRKANAAQRSMNRRWRVTSPRATVCAGAVMGRADV